MTGAITIHNENNKAKAQQQWYGFSYKKWLEWEEYDMSNVRVHNIFLVYQK